VSTPMALAVTRSSSAIFALIFVVTHFFTPCELLYTMREPARTPCAVVHIAFSAPCRSLLQPKPVDRTGPAKSSLEADPQRQAVARDPSAASDSVACTCAQTHRHAPPITACWDASVVNCLGVVAAQEMNAT
jgi:hypothetical protein